MAKRTPDLLIVTGFSGAGRASALKHLEDLGYEVFDNFPLSLTAQLAADPLGEGHPVAVGIDTRSRGFSPEAVIETVEKLNARLLFMSADESVLQRRFTETRRRHPLAKDRPVSAGIRKEMEWLYGLKASADIVIDTSELSIHDLRRVLEGSFGQDTPNRLTVTVLSFAFRHGVPREADMVLDTRFLRNPHWDNDLRPLTGLDQAVRDYVFRDEAYVPFMEHLKTLIRPLLPRYASEGKSYFTLAFGCTGGQHRSVTAAETIKPWLESQGLNVSVLHRDIDRT